MNRRNFLVKMGMMLAATAAASAVSGPLATGEQLAGVSVIHEQRSIFEVLRAAKTEYASLDYLKIGVWGTDRRSPERHMRVGVIDRQLFTNGVDLERYLRHIYETTRFTLKGLKNSEMRKPDSDVEYYIHPFDGTDWEIEIRMDGKEYKLVGKNLAWPGPWPA